MLLYWVFEVSSLSRISAYSTLGHKVTQIQLEPHSVCPPIDHWYFSDYIYISLFSCIENSDGCVGKRSFFHKKTIHNTKQVSLFGFSISCTTNTVYAVRYTNGSPCNCGEYFLKDQTKHEICDARLIRLNFTVEISVTNIRNQWGENCSFFFFFPGEGNIESDIRILPGNVSTTLQPSLTTTMMELPGGTVDVCDNLSV